MKGYFDNMLVITFLVDHPYTRAMIAESDTVDDWGDVYEGWSKCHGNDTANPNKGKKLALARALAKTSLCKAQRAKVWAAFHGCSKDTMIVNLDEAGK